MEKNELKKIIKPLIKECIREVFMEQGFIKLIGEATTQTKQQVTETIKKPVQEVKQQVRPQINANQKLMAEEIRKSGFVSKSFDPFANTNALTEAQAGNLGSAPATGPLANIDPNDSGVDISNLMNGNKNVWKALLGGKG